MKMTQGDIHLQAAGALDGEASIAGPATTGECAWMATRSCAALTALVQRLVRCGRASQFDPATDKIYKQQINKPIGCQADGAIPADADTSR
uniref:Uncharacterized protein n=1 Tax=Oryza sativa subsp. japonica TaxID=39947 RepID=Q8LIS0_ORYSJ|nr:hypothetical protein [Oryza sativa Japonica Group]BAD31197.1 hypothetical protein [Oryza sativa Japonica Group]